MVAGEPSYQLVLAPKDHRSLVGKVVIAIDGKYGVPLRVQVFAKGASSAPRSRSATPRSSASPRPRPTSSFTPPHGASVDVVNLSDQASGKSAARPAASHERLRQLRQELAHRGGAAAEGPHAGIRNGCGSGSASAAHGSRTAPAATRRVGGYSQEVLNALLGAAKPVHGSWGSGTLVTTSLVSMLMTGGEVYIGAVQPSVLYAAVGHTTS